MQTRKLTEVPQAEVKENTNIIVEIDGELKRVAKEKLVSAKDDPSKCVLKEVKW